MQEFYYVVLSDKGGELLVYLPSDHGRNTWWRWIIW